MSFNGYVMHVNIKCTSVVWWQWDNSFWGGLKFWIYGEGITIDLGFLHKFLFTIITLTLSYCQITIIEEKFYMCILHFNCLLVSYCWHKLCFYLYLGFFFFFLVVVVVGFRANWPCGTLDMLILSVPSTLLFVSLGIKYCCSLYLGNLYRVWVLNIIFVKWPNGSWVFSFSYL